MGAPDYHDTQICYESHDDLDLSFFMGNLIRLYNTQGLIILCAPDTDVTLHSSQEDTSASHKKKKKKKERQSVQNRRFYLSISPHHLFLILKLIPGSGHFWYFDGVGDRNYSSSSVRFLIHLKTAFILKLFSFDNSYKQKIFVIVKFKVYLLVWLRAVFKPKSPDLYLIYMVLFFFVFT